MAMRKSSRNYIHKRFDEIHAEPERIEGFVGIIPQRKEFVGDLQKIIDANEGSSREHSRSCWIPFSEEYKAHRYALSDAIRSVTEAELGGYFQPMTGDDLVLELTVYPPEKSRRKNRLNDIIATLVDAMHFNAWTTDGKRLGLFSEDADIQFMPLRKVRYKEGNPEGIHYAIYHEAPTQEDEGLPKEHANQLPVVRTVGQIVAEMEGKEAGAKKSVAIDPERLGINREMALRVSCLADKKTPLHPEVLRYYEFLLERYNRKTARRLALYEQTRIDTTVLFDGEEAATEIIEELRGRTDRLVESMDMRSLSLSEADE